MEKRIPLLAFVFIVVCMSSMAVYALPPMGPPKAVLGQDRWDIGIEYGYRTMDLEAVGQVQDIQGLVVTTRKGKHNIDDLKSNILMGRAGYGINDSWDAFVRLGVTDAQSDIVRIYSDGATQDKYEGFDGKFGLAAGFGTRATFWQDEDVSWGGLFQMTWSEPDGGDISLAGDPVFSGNAEIKIWEVQVALGPTWQVVDNFCVYGGPFMHFVGGDLDLSGQTVDMATDIGVIAEGDIEEKSQLGGYVGAHLGVDKNTFCFLEFQLTGDAMGIGIGGARRF